MDKMVDLFGQCHWTKWYGQNGRSIRTMSLDKMVWTKWYGQNGTDEMVAGFGIDYN